MLPEPPQCVRVLLIEDSAMEAQLVSDTLAFARNPRIEVHHSRRLKEGLQELAVAHFDVVMLDLGLPDSHDLSGLMQVLEAAPTAAVVVRTGLGDESVALEALSSGAQDYLIKGHSGSIEMLERSIRFALARRQAEHAARQLAAIVDASDDAIIGRSADGTITSWNRAAERMFGYTAEEIVGRPDTLLCATVEQIADLAELRDRAARGESIVHHETSRRRKDGTVIDVSLTMSPIRNRDGLTLALSTIARDVSAQKRADRARERTLAELREAQRLALIGSWTWDPMTGDATWTEQMYRIFGRDPERGPLVADQLMPYIHAEDRERAALAYAGVLTGASDAELDFRIITDDGTEKTLHALARVDPDRPGSVVGTVQDVTTLRATERALREGSELLSQVLDSAPIGLALVAVDGTWRRVNRALCEIVGYSEAELATRSLQDLTHPDDHDADREYVRRMLAGEIRTFVMEKRYLHKQGRIVWVNLSASLLRDEHGDAVEFIYQFEDVTERRRAEEQLRESERQLADAQALAHVGSWEWNLGEARQSWSDELCRIYGRPPGFSPTFEEYLTVVHPDDREAMIAGIRGAEQARPSDSEFRIIRPDGEERHVHARSYGRSDTGDDVTHLFGTVQDVTERKRAELALQSERKRYEAELERLARNDALTGLANQRMFHERLSDEFARAARHGRRLSLVILDVDHFKRINDRHGHAIGDEVLREVAERLAAMAREGELLARVGGEEFGWILPDATGEGALAAAERARMAIGSRPFQTVGAVTISAGVCDTARTHDITELFQRADAALYMAKDGGRNQCHLYNTREAVAGKDQAAPAS
jgi:diguanylate cyclase (GGDEF)-like protein/PAS domain S-box-containing protein